MTQTESIEFCKYLQPIISGCLGFIKTDGYFAHVPGIVMAMSADEMSFSIIRLPIVFDVSFAASPNRFLGLKEEEEMANFLANSYFIGSNIKFNTMVGYYYRFCSVESRKMIYSEDDCMKIEGFEEAVSKTSISFVKVSDGTTNYMIPASKAITPVTKSDSASLAIFEYDVAGYQRIKTFRYITMKKKFKLCIEYYSNILVM